MGASHHVTMLERERASAHVSMSVTAVATIFYMAVAIQWWHLFMTENGMSCHLPSLALGIMSVMLLASDAAQCTSDGNTIGTSIVAVMSLTLIMSACVVCGAAEPMLVLALVVLCIPMSLVVLTCSIMLVASTAALICARRLCPDVIVVLGSSSAKGNPNETQRMRCERAAGIASRSSIPPVIIASGGHTWSDDVSEAEAICSELDELVVPCSIILRDDDAMSTEENIIDVMRLVDAMPGRQVVSVVTSGYHVLRTTMICRRSNAHMHVIPCQSPLRSFPQDWSREAFVLLSCIWKSRRGQASTM